MSNGPTITQNSPSLDEMLLAAISRWGQDHNGGTVDLTETVKALSTVMAAMITEAPEPADQVRLAELATAYFHETHAQMDAAKRSREGDAAHLSRN